MCFLDELELYLSLKINVIVFLVLHAEQQLNCLCGELFTRGTFVPRAG